MLFEVENSKTQFHGVIKEEHNSTCDSKGNFLFHFTPEEATKDISHAKIIATRYKNDWKREVVKKQLLSKMVTVQMPILVGKVVMWLTWKSFFL